MDQTIPRQPGQPSAKAMAHVIEATANPPALTASKASYGSFPTMTPAGGRFLEADKSMRPASRLAQLDRSYLSWRKRAIPKSSFVHDGAEPPITSDDLDADTGFIEDSQSALQALQSQLQDTYSATSVDTSEDEYAEDHGGEDDEPSRPHTPPVHPVDPINSPQSEELEEQPLPGSLDDTVLDDLDVSMLHELTDLPHTSSPIPREKSEYFPDDTKFPELPINVFPPPPNTSVVRPETLPSQVTKHLAAIKAENPNRFRPIKVWRDLEHDERGFWRIDCTCWSLDAQRDFWSLLCEHVCSGQVGWATTLHREPVVHSELGLVRLYCWGEVVEHMWLLIWLCSKAKASGMESKWIDANGIAVIEMV